METITYAKVEELVKQLSERKLLLAYRLLQELADKDKDEGTLSPQLEFIHIPLGERRRIMAQQADQIKAHYEQTSGERIEWQAGDFLVNPHTENPLLYRTEVPPKNWTVG